MDVDAAHLTVNIVAVITLLVATWHISASAAKVQRSSEDVNRELPSLKSALEQLPLIMQRLSMIESEQVMLRKKLFSEFPQMKARVAVLEEKASSTDRFKAMRASRPDIDED